MKSVPISNHKKHKRKSSGATNTFCLPQTDIVDLTSFLSQSSINYPRAKKRTMGYYPYPYTEILSNMHSHTNFDPSKQSIIIYTQPISAQLHKYYQPLSSQPICNQPPQAFPHKSLSFQDHLKNLEAKGPEEEEEVHRKIVQMYQPNLKIAMAQHINSLQSLYGFTADPSKTFNTTNFNNAIKQQYTHNQHLPRKPLQKQLLLPQPSLTVHNLCREKQPAVGTRSLLGLALKYCIASPKSSPKLKECMQILAYTVRTKH